jgi:hypothetical protein
MPLLDNPVESPCFGCGPRHARGLRLQFARERAADGVDEVVCTYTPKQDEVGWPGLFHTGLHYTVVYEASYWAAWELSGHVGVPRGPSTWEQQRLPVVGQPFQARARLATQDRDGVRVRAVSATPDGQRVFATLDAGFRFSRREVVQKAGLQLPDYLLRDMVP